MRTQFCIVQCEEAGGGKKVPAKEIKRGQPVMQEENLESFVPCVK